ncbi:TSUP family transporter [Aeoliella sp. SH292]|uniref:TSUP family transporter n=1 Tax=Aeoliella sp. SH292 TaxID=3454464 RepID=UPI003F996F9C
MQLLGLPIESVVLAIVVTTLGAVVQGSVGFGLAMVSAPVLLIIAPTMVPGSLMLSATALSLMVLCRERHAVVGSEVVISSLARFATTLPTAYLVSMIDQRLFNILFAIVILVAVGIGFGGWSLPFTRTNLFLVSLVSGISNTLAATGGPPMALVYQSQRGEHIRATLSAIFAIGSTFAILCLAWVGKFTVDDAWLGLLLLPGIILGFWISTFATRYLDQRAMRPAVLGVSAASAMAILVRAMWTTG